MTHAATLLQTNILTALAPDVQLTALIGADGTFDRAPKARQAPYVTLARHDVLARDADLAPGNDHRLQFDAWYPSPDRSGALAIAERLVSVLLAADLSSDDLAVTHARHVRTDTRIDPKSGHARASVQLQFFSEPAA